MTIAASYRVSETVPSDGIYRAHHHSANAVSYEPLLAGELFPRCAVCGFALDFESVGELPLEVKGGEVRAGLFEIPHPG